MTKKPKCDFCGKPNKNKVGKRIHEDRYCKSNPESLVNKNKEQPDPAQAEPESSEPEIEEIVQAPATGEDLEPSPESKPVAPAEQIIPLDEPEPVQQQPPAAVDESEEDEDDESGEETESKFMEWLPMIIVIVGVIVLAIGIFLFFRNRQKKKEQEKIEAKRQQQAQQYHPQNEVVQHG